jgi:hypothetical protein
MNQPRFQDDLLALTVEEAGRVLHALEKMRKLAWAELYRDKGLRWEAVDSQKGPAGERLYSFRATQKIRVLAYRDKEWARLILIHPDHDSAYK